MESVNSHFLRFFFSRGEKIAVHWLRPTPIFKITDFHLILIQSYFKTGKGISDVASNVSKSETLPSNVTGNSGKSVLLVNPLKPKPRLHSLCTICDVITFTTKDVLCRVKTPSQACSDSCTLASANTNIQNYRFSFDFNSVLFQNRQRDFRCGVNR